MLACSRTIVDDFGEIIYLGERTSLHDAAVAQSVSRRLRSRLWMISPKSSTILLEVVYSVLPCSGAIVDDFGEIIYLEKNTSDSKIPNRIAVNNFVDMN